MILKNVKVNDGFRTNNNVNLSMHKNRLRGIMLKSEEYNFVCENKILAIKHRPSPILEVEHNKVDFGLYHITTIHHNLKKCTNHFEIS